MESPDNDSTGKSGGRDPNCLPQADAVVIPPNEVSLLVAGAALGGLLFLTLGILIGMRLDK